MRSMISGMTTANMKLVTLNVVFPGKLETPDQKLDDGEAIVRRVVELEGLYKELKGSFRLVKLAKRLTSPTEPFTEYEKKVSPLLNLNHTSIESMLGLCR